MKLQHLSAVTLAVQNMAQSVEFYRKLGLELLYGGEWDSFTTFRANEGFINLRLINSQAGKKLSSIRWAVEDVELLYSKLKESGLEPEAPREGDRGERFFFLKDPDGHELSFAQ